jgi:hypothetical protein
VALMAGRVAFLPKVHAVDAMAYISP